MKHLLPSQLLTIMGLNKNNLMKKDIKKPKQEKKGKIAKRIDDKLRDYLMARANYKCELCLQPANSAHHLIFRSRAKHLQFEPKNLIVVCQKCHYRFHQADGHIMFGRVIRLRGQKWFDELEKLKNNRPKSSYWTKKYLYEKEKEIDELTNLNYS